MDNIDIKKITTLKDLKASHYQSVSIKDEIRNNLLNKLRSNEKVFQGVWGYEDTVIPEIERALLSKHHINLLGLRGQAKTRLARQMVDLLDEWMPIVKGSEINDDPFQPISRFAKLTLEEMGDKTPIEWVHRDDRFFEKLATPDVSVADIIGDVDPIKAANLKLSFADDRVIHFGMIPRANRCIFVINEIPDLQARIQVSLFNILQEGDVQIRGFKLRLPLDMQFVFTANPEDYTNRGSIVTPLKDRIGSQILTHYPDDMEIAKKITKQEAQLNSEQIDKIYIPEFARDLIEQISFEARKSEMIDHKSGVSARMSITSMENLISTAERRILLNGDPESSVRLSDFFGIVPSITGKVELVYEGEQEGSSGVAISLIDSAVQSLFSKVYPKIEKLEKQDAISPYQKIFDWFYEGEEFELLDDLPEKEYRKKLDSIEPVNELVSSVLPDMDERDQYFLKEFLLWGLVENKKLSKSRMQKGLFFKDIYGSYISGLN